MSDGQLLIFDAGETLDILYFSDNDNRQGCLCCYFKNTDSSIRMLSNMKQANRSVTQLHNVIVNILVRERRLKQQSLLFKLHKRYYTMTQVPLIRALDCPYCHEQKFHHTALTEATDIPGKKQSCSRQREKSLTELAKSIMPSLVHSQWGLIREFQSDLQMPMAAVSAKAYFKENGFEYTLGRGESYVDCKTMCVLEALERYSGVQGYKEAKTIYTSYELLGDSAVDPKRLTLHSPSQYATHPYCRSFVEKEQRQWLKCTELASREDYWLPASMAFYGKQPVALSPPIAFTSSNGCALGGSQEEATLHGLLEVIERDAFMMSWYTRSGVRDVTDDVLCRYRSVRNRYYRVQSILQSDIRLLINTQDHEIPTLLAIMTNSRGPCHFALAAGVGLDYEDAIMSALCELSGQALRLAHKLLDPKVKMKALALVDDPSAVKTMDDHGLINSVKLTPHIDFLLNAVKSDLPPLPALLRKPGATPAECLQTLVRHLKTLHYTFYAVEQSPKVVREHQLSVVKVLGEAMLPITFGYGNERVQSTRLADKLGLDPNEDIYLHCDHWPHPFP